jgi:hypothetical protein
MGYILGMRKPYLAHLGAVAGVHCWLVDGTWIRNRRDVDFTNGAHHLTRAYVPFDEVWIDREAPGAGELEFLWRHQLHERALMLNGTPYLQALARANRAERRARREWLVEPHLPVAAARALVLRHHLGVLDGDAIWVVDGRAVRDRFDPNFTHGGHHWRYRFIPRRHIWIDDAVVERELEFTLAHEAHELALMRAGMKYDDAHDHALLVEKSLRRRRPSRSIAMLPRLIAA